MNQLFLSATQLFPDFGLAVIALTLLLRLLLSPLQLMAAKAAKKMKDIQPELSSIKEKWKDDSHKMSEETMKLFKQKSINPLMSFIPLLLQLPLFYVFYNLLTNFPGIAGTYFALPDPFFVMPILAGALQFAQMFFSGQETPKAMKVMMPLVFTGIMIKLPVAVLIYTITSSVYSLIEKGIFNRMIG